MPPAAGNSRPRPLRMPPMRAIDLAPPRRSSDALRGREVLRQQAPEDERPPEPLSLGHIGGLVHERPKVVIRDRAAIDPEHRQLDVAPGTFSVLRVRPG